LSHLRHQPAEVWIQLRRATGQVDGHDVRARRQKFEHAARYGLTHDLGARGAGLHVTVVASLVAALADVHLECRRLAAEKRTAPVTRARSVEMGRLEHRYPPFTDQP